MDEGRRRGAPRWRPWFRRSPTRPAPTTNPEEIAGDIRSGLLWALGFGIAGLVPLGVFLLMFLPDQRVANGEQAEAIVTEVLDERRACEGRSSRAAPETSAVRVEFVTSRGESQTAVMRTTRACVAVGEPVRLTYLPGDPARVRAIDGPERAWRVPLIVAGSLWFIAGCALWIALRLRLGRPGKRYFGLLEKRRDAREGEQ